jgi:hypothetical protein
MHQVDKTRPSVKWFSSSRWYQAEGGHCFWAGCKAHFNSVVPIPPCPLGPVSGVCSTATATSHSPGFSSVGATLFSTAFPLFNLMVWLQTHVPIKLPTETHMSMAGLGSPKANPHPILCERGHTMGCPLWWQIWHLLSTGSGRLHQHTKSGPHSHTSLLRETLHLALQGKARPGTASTSLTARISSKLG